MGPYAGYIYCITNLVDGRQYVGQTSMTVRKRYKAHLRCAESESDTTSLLYNAMRKYGIDNFSVTTIETVYAETRDELKSMLNDREVFHILNKNTYKPNGYNMTEGGNAVPGCIVKPVYKVDSDGTVIERYDSIVDAETQNGLPLGSIKGALSRDTHHAGGAFWYDASENTMSIGQNIGKQKTQLVPACCFSLSGVLIKRFNSIVDAEKSTGIPHSHISSACSEKRKSAGGYLWSYDINAPKYAPKYKECRNRPVVQMDLQGNIINEFCSATHASKELGLQQSLISACCLGKRKSTGGYRWAFLN